MKPIAIIGAGGYVGARLIEKAVLIGDLPLVPIVRSWRSQGRLARYGVQTVQGNASDADSLIPLLKGCGMAVNLTMGENERIVENVKAVHKACLAAKVPLLVHMSSAEVFGRAEAPDLVDNSVPRARHWMEYARAKAAAETWLRAQSDGPVQIVILRPGLIWGPGSGWLVQPALEMVNRTAYLFKEGRGICNLIHVDNLIQHLDQLARANTAESGVFNISDMETLNWADYYRAIANEIGIDAATIQLLPDAAFSEGFTQRVVQLGQLAPAKAIKSRMTSATKVRIKQQFADRFHPPASEETPIEPIPSITKSLWWIQGTERKLPALAFRQRYPETRLQPFPELMAAAGQWLRFAGFAATDRDSSAGPP
jgi:nucleoside-diphosphate-sugar epimerase